MSSYPPPPPPPSGPYPPVYDRRTMRVQRQILRAQARAQQAQQRALRYQLRAQRRALRRGSIVGPLLIVAVGVVLLLAQTGRLSCGQSLAWYGRWWPAVLIAAGIILLLEWALDQRSGRPASVRVVGGGVVSSLILLAVLGLASRALQYGFTWRNQLLDNQYDGLDYLFGEEHDANSSMSQTLPAGSSLVLHDPHGDVTVTGASSDGQVHVNLYTQTYGWKKSDVERKQRDLQPTFSSNQSVWTLSVKSVDGGQANLSVEIPHGAPLTIQADRGDVTVSEMAAPVVVSANHGDVKITGVAGAVTLHANDDDSNITLHSIQGPISLDGHSGDIDISEVTGDLTLHGDFFGTTDLEHINGAIHFNTSRTQFSAARLDDEFSVDSDSLDADEMLGPVVLTTEDKDVTLDRVQGSVNVSDRNGSVELTCAAPLHPISIDNRHGSVDVGLPGNSGFVLNAHTRNGDMENDFGLTPQGTHDAHSLQGMVDGGGPAVTIATTDGDVTVRRSIVAPLPSAPPAPPKITWAPGPRSPQPPKVPRSPRTPASLKQEAENRT